MRRPHTGHSHTLLESILFRKRVEVKVFIALDHTQTNERKETIDLIYDQRYPPFRTRTNSLNALVYDATSNTS